MAQTPANLTGVYKLQPGEGIVLAPYQGIRFTMIPATGGTMRYSQIDDPSIKPVSANHDPATQFDITLQTTIDVAWPWYLVTCETGAGRVAIV